MGVELVGPGDAPPGPRWLILTVGVLPGWIDRGGWPRSPDGGSVWTMDLQGWTFERRGVDCSKVAGPFGAVSSTAPHEVSVFVCGWPVRDLQVAWWLAQQ